MDTYSGKYYPKEVAVIIQWSAKCNNGKIYHVMRNWQNKNSEIQAPKKAFKFNALDGEKCEDLTGYSFNAVTPFLFNKEIPVLISKEIAELSPRCFWMGGGNADTKMRIGFEEFVEKSEYDVIVGDVSDPRLEFENGSQEEISSDK